MSLGTRRKIKLPSSSYEERCAKRYGYPPVMTNEEFRDRIRRLCGVPEGTGRKANPCVVRKPTDQPTPSEEWYKAKERNHHERTK